jgi:hypothetical protein
MAVFGSKLFWGKNCEIGHKKIALAAKVANFIKMLFNFEWLIDHLRMYRTINLS